MRSKQAQNRLLHHLSLSFQKINVIGPMELKLWAFNPSLTCASVGCMRKSAVIDDESR